MRRYVPYNIVHLPEVNSTNLYLKSLLEEKEVDEVFVVVADYQTQGRGQMGNSWLSNRGENLLFSLLIQPVMIQPVNQFIISRMISVAIQQVLAGYIAGVKIKWPNDIYCANKKIGGILIENILQGNQIVNSIIGVGINVNQLLFPAFLPNPVSLRQIYGREMVVENLLHEILEHFFVLYDALTENRDEGFEEEYKLHLYQLNEKRTYKDEGGVFEGLITDVLSTGHLEVEHLATEERKLYAFKEIEFIIEN